MTVNVLSAVFLSKYDFTDISSVFGIIVILKNFKTVPNQTLSRSNGIMNENLFVPQHHWQKCSPTKAASTHCSIVLTKELKRGRRIQYVKRRVIPSGKCLIGNVFFSITMIPSTLLLPVKSYLERKTADKTLTVMDWPPQSFYNKWNGSLLLYILKKVLNFQLLYPL